MLEHPLNDVDWLAKGLPRHQQAIKKGDLISRRSFSRLLSPKAGLQVEAVYLALPGWRRVSVSFH